MSILHALPPLRYSVPFLKQLPLICAVLFFCVGQAHAASANYFVGDEPKLRVEENRVMLSIPLSVSDEDSLRSMLQDGAVMALDIKVVMERERTLWFNEDIAEVEFTWNLRLDPLTREYSITGPALGNGQHTAFSDRSLRRLLAATWKLLDLNLADAALFDSQEEYLFIITRSLRYAELPPWLDHALVLWSRDIVSPETIKLDVRFSDAALSR